MNGLRHHLRRRRHLAAWLLAFALMLKMVVPSGYMLDTSGRSLGFVLCSGMAPVNSAAMTMAHHAMPAAMSHHERKDDHKPEQPCDFAGLNAPSLAAADPILLVLAIAFVIAAVFRHGDPPLIGASLRLRPPLRGPPLPR